VAAPRIIPAVFGTSFNAAVPIARILAIGAIVNYALQAACGRLLGRRQPWTVAVAQGLGVIVFTIGIVSFPTLQGAAWSSVTSFAVSLVFAEIALRSRPARGPTKK
jgi:O-antigen/teichoic acid export membrane protein